MALAVAAAGGCARPPDASVRVSEARRLMGAPWTIVVHAPSERAGRSAITAAFAEIERLERVLSDYDPDSELSRLSAAAPMAEPVAVSDDLWRVLVAAEACRNSSAGAFDISVGSLTTLWRQSRRSGKLPRPDKLAAARLAVGAAAVELDPLKRTVRLPLPGTRLDPGGIGMGYAADRALDVLADHGIAAAMIDASGDVLVSNAPPGAAGWRIAVAPLGSGDEGAMILLANAAVTTSGDAHQAVEIDGVRYSHIVDPRTGLGVRGPTAASVVAQDATTADALATAASVLGPVDGCELVAARPGCCARFAWREGTETRWRTTPGWPGRQEGAGSDGEDHSRAKR